MANRLSHKILISLILFTFVVSPLTPVLAEGEETVSSTISDSTSIEPNQAVVPTDISLTTPEPDVVSTTEDTSSSPVEADTVSSTTDVVSSTENAPAAPVEPVVTSTPTKRWYYKTLMRDARKATEEGSLEQKSVVAQDISKFVTEEKQTLDNLGVESEKQKKYFDRLHVQARLLDKTQSTIFEKIKDFLGNIFDGSKENNSKFGENTKEEKIPLTPPTFHFSEDSILVEPLQNPVLHPSVGQKIQTELKNFITIPPVNAMDDQYLPVLQDVQASSDTPESDTIKELARSLHNNPVEITNFVKNSIRFEPYLGLKKGALGCLEQKVCNDTDAAALTIALMRSSGIPAHYKKSLVIFSVNDLKNLLGVEDIKSVFSLFALSKIPVYTVTVPIPAGATLDQVNLSAETLLAVQWVVPEIFFEYDEQGANKESDDTFAFATSTEALRSALHNFPTKQWIPLDVVVRPATHQKNPILSERANINVSNFWNSYLTFQGNSSPLQKFRADIQTALAVSATSSLSTVTAQERKFSVLSLSYPFVFASAVQNGNPINEEIWSSVPDAFRPQLRISLLAANNQVVLEKNFFSNEIDNKEINLKYEGLSDADKRVIEQYGGVQQTPAELVDIVPYFQSATGRIYQNNPVGVNIGDTLTLRFEMFLGGQSIQRDEKFSVAGNSEGIYIIFSQVAEKPEYTTNQKILAGGNAALAWKYLSHIEEERKFLNEFYDFSSNLHFARAVVTENRILTPVNNSPTTFDFKGLTIDAGAYLAGDVSRRDGYTAHRTDVRRLFGLEASFYEGKLFEEVAGLDGISTVRGLQYAASQPQTYSILRITLANEGIIDGLPFSVGTKQNMHTAVRAGNTVITPSRFVQMGNWRGVLYINLSAAGTGQYAIGEQALQNGGWTTVLLQSRLYQVTPQDVREGFLANFGTSHFYYEDGKNYDTVLCRITADEYNLITRNANWRPEYGYPCLTENKAFGNTLHNYILSSNGTYFFSPGLYDYWISRDNVKGVLLTDKNGDPSERLMNVRLDGEFKFNPIAGTYSWFGHYDGPAEDWNMFADCRDCITAYYQPTQNGIGHGRLVYGSILRKLSEPHFDAQKFLCSAQDPYCSKRNWILNSFGFPLMNRAPAATSMSESTGDYQAFVGGHVYRKNDWHQVQSLTYIVPNEILTFYNARENCRIVNNGNPQCGTGGIFGFPYQDPVLQQNILLQNFEEAGITFDRTTQSTRLVQQSENSRRAQNKEFARKLVYLSAGSTANNTPIEANQIISSAEAFARISDYVASRVNTSDAFIKDLTILLTGYEKIFSAEYAFQKTANVFPYINFSSPYQVKGLSDTGFKFKYNDSHYCLANRDTGVISGFSPQVYHSMGGFNIAYYNGESGAAFATYIHDINPGPFGEGKIIPISGISFEDIDLGLIMGHLGAELRAGIKTKDQVGTWIRSYLKNEVESPARSLDVLKNECVTRKKFREYERAHYSVMQDLFFDRPYIYLQDYKVQKCNGVDTFYQEYQAFRTVGPAWVVLNGENQFLIKGDNLAAYKLSGGTCSNLGLPIDEDVNNLQHFEHGSISNGRINLN